MKKKENNIIYGRNEDKSIQKDELVYDPVAGLTIEDALAQAIIMSKKTNEHVHAIINDIHMYINPQTSLKIAHAAYKKVSDAKYRAALRACEKLKRIGVNRE